MNKIKINDNFAGNGADVMQTTCQYESGYYDRKERDFYGFAKVTEKQYDTTYCYFGLL
jgi:hypothetical protein